MVLKEYPGDTR